MCIRDREWAQWLRNSVVRRVGAQEARSIPKEAIFKIPMRVVRTNRSKVVGELIAKSRATLPGHMDPGLGDYRTDAPTTTSLAVDIMLTLAVSLGWTIRLFDVTTAFLSGKELLRKLYARAPKEGFPAVGSEPAVKAFELLEILKSAYGLAEAPRLWYLRVLELLED